MKGKLPALITLIAILIALPATVFLVKRQQTYLGQASNEDSPYGMNTALFWHNKQIFPEEKWEIAIDNMAKAGVKFNRTSIVWALIQPTQEEWDWEKHDRFINLLVSKGISPLGYFYFTPKFAWKYPTICDTARWGGQICAPKPDAWENFIKKTVERYGCGPGGKCQIKYWEIWNEPNSNSTDKVKCKSENGESISLCGTIDDYFEMLRVAYGAIKAVDPNATVVMAGLGQGSTATDGFLDQLLAKKYQNKPCGNFFDVLNIHHYYGLSPTFLDAVKKGLEKAKTLRQKYGLSNKSIWVTEFNRGNGHCSSDLVKTANNQIAAINVLLKNGAQKVFWFKVDTSDVKCGHLGILDNVNFELINPFYQAYQTMAMPSPTPPSLLTPTPAPPNSITGFIWIDNNGDGRYYWDIKNGKEEVYSCSGTQTKPKLDFYLIDTPGETQEVRELDNGYFTFSSLTASKYHLTISQIPVCNGIQYQVTKWQIKTSPSDGSQVYISLYDGGPGTKADSTAWTNTPFWCLKVNSGEITRVYLGIKPK